MENFIIYILKVNLSLGILTMLYWFFFRKDTFFSIKRAYFIIAILISFVYPFIYPVRLLFFDRSEIIENTLYQVYLTPVIITQNPSNQFNETSLLLAIAFTGSFLLLIKLFIQVISILNLRYQNRKVNNIIEVNNKIINPFSFFNWIFLNSNKVSKEKVNSDYIICHEQIHVKHKHSIDTLMIEIVCILFWWNPLVWLLNRELRINLEYIVDNQMQTQCIDIKKYQYSLLALSLQKKTILTAVNHYNFSQLKKRIIMMNKLKSARVSMLKYTLILPAIMLMISINVTSQDKKNNIKTSVQEILIQVKPETSSQSDKVHMTAEKMPVFKGGTKEMMNYIITNLKYPKEAVKNKQEGKVVVRFIVSETGEVKDAEIIKYLSKECDAEAIRVVNAMPNWTPGYIDGKAVSVYCTIPIMYKLTKDENNKTK